MVGAGEEHVDFIAEGVGGATGAGPGGVRDMAASGEGQKAVGGEVAALAAQPEEGDSRVGGKEPEVEGGLVEVGPLEVGRVQVEVGIAAGEGGLAGAGWMRARRQRSETTGRRERAYARSMLAGLQVRARRG